MLVLGHLSHREGRQAHSHRDSQQQHQRKDEGVKFVAIPVRLAQTAREQNLDTEGQQSIERLDTETSHSTSEEFSTQPLGIRNKILYRFVQNHLLKVCRGAPSANPNTEKRVNTIGPNH
jgi:hypothetical protein